MDFDYAHYMLTEGPKEIENPVVPFASTVAYRKRLAEALNLNRTRILAFKNKIPERIELIPKDYLSPFPQSRSDKPMRYIPQSPEKTLDAPGLLKDLSLNLLDWGSSNVISIGLENSVFLWNALDSSSTELVTVEEEMGPVTSVSWAPDGRLLAVGLNNSHVQLWDSTTSRLIRILDGHEGRVGSLAWNDHILTTAGKDKKIFNNDIRVGSHVVETYRGHQQEICGLKWAPSGKLLTSGGNDNLVHIWDRSLASSNSPTRWLHRFNDHRAAVKALAWCPFNNYLLASGGSEGDHSIKFWNTNTGFCLNSIETGSPVSSLLWNKNHRELLSSHGFTQNQLTLWKYPSMGKMAELHGDTSSVLFMAQSPDGCTVATAAADEALRLWNVFGTPAPKANKKKPIDHFHRFIIR